MRSDIMLTKAVELLQRWLMVDTADEPYFLEGETAAFFASLGADHG